MLIGAVGAVCDVYSEGYHYCHLIIALLGGCGLRGGRGTGNYGTPISMRYSLIKYSNRKPVPRSNASGKLPDRQPARQLRKLFGDAYSNKDWKRLPFHPPNHRLRPKLHR